MSLRAPASNEILSAIRGAAKRVTVAKRTVAEVLVAAPGHLTAEEITQEVQSRQPDVSPSTVYRILEEFEAMQIVVHAHLDQHAAVFHLAGAVHGHLTCDECGATFEIPAAHFDALEQGPHAYVRLHAGPAPRRRDRHVRVLPGESTPLARTLSALLNAGPPRVDRVLGRVSGTPMIKVDHLTKRYSDTLAVDDLDFEVKPGVVTGFLGPNGSGKSTTMRIILGLDRATKGQATINGTRYAELKDPIREVGALLDAKAVHPGRTARNHLRALAASNQIKRSRVDEVLDFVGISSVADKKVGTYSLGMSQRLGIAGALLGDPGVLLVRRAGQRARPRRDQVDPRLLSRPRQRRAVPSSSAPTS